MNLYYLCIAGAFIVSLTCGLLFIPAILNFCKARKLYDIPNGRKIHTNAVPRLGGISFIPGMLLAFVMASMFIGATTGRQITISLWSLMFPIGMLIIYATGIADDIIGLPPFIKLIVQIIAACLLPAAGLYINDMHGFLGINEIPYFTGFALTVLIIVFIDNAINLIDGIDGLAAGLTLIALFGFLILFIHQRVWVFSLLISGLAGVIVAFLRYNLFGNESKGRKIFMGDSGSLSLGYILGFLCVKYSMDNPAVLQYPKADFIIPFTLLVVPIFDVVRVFIVRLRHHKSPFSADKRHIHHKLMEAGMSQRATLITILSLALTYILITIAMLPHIDNNIIFVIDIVIYIIFNAAINIKIEQKHNKK